MFGTSPPFFKLRATMALFRWLAVETAERWGYSYPAASGRYAAEMVEKLLEIER